MAAQVEASRDLNRIPADLTLRRGSTILAGTPGHERISGLCRVVFTRGELRGSGNAPTNQITKVSVGIIRVSALWNLYRYRHKWHGEVSEDLLLKEKEFAGLRSRLLKGAADFYVKLERLLEGQSDPSSLAALGRAYHDLGELTGEIGNDAEALDVHRKALDVRRELAGRPVSGDAAVLDVVRSLYAVGLKQHATGDRAGRGRRGRRRSAWPWGWSPRAGAATRPDSS